MKVSIHSVTSVNSRGFDFIISWDVYKKTEFLSFCNIHWTEVKSPLWLMFFTAEKINTIVPVSRVTQV